MLIPFFNKNFVQTLMGGQKHLEVTSPNGGVYRFSTNTLDDKTFKEYQEKFKAATESNNQEEFDKLWEELTQSNGLRTSFESEFKNFHQEMEKFFEDASPFFKSNGGLFSDKFKPHALTTESIDERIKKHQEHIEQLTQLKSNMDVEKKKLELQNQISVLKSKIDEKLDALREHLDNEEMKKKITDELTSIHNEIKTLENELQNI